ncbi:MAG: type VI secretion protein VasK [Acidocella sp. 20-57-95]|nr:MAG: type VI secretion protein VasK [Acidocella sp. 20-57-95]OYV62526.1 MAG: type VI secretion protein VasK [Acidocella sp. 21-58-7]HQT63794.1 type VI secretion system membrane subunit TssM [Acidocella sp.]HQU03198.1 type VI secretion system membrane subunit TssM [Acidocella sp.]
MHKIIGFFSSRWFLSFVGVAVLAALVWYFGPFWSLLTGLIARLVVIGVMLLVWLLVNLLLDRRRRKREDLLAAGVAAAPPNAKEMAAAEELAAMAEKLKTSLALLRKARGTKGYIYEQPWYVIIGPPGAGKTTALLNAGLKFPLAAELGQGAVAGVGGTRLCDWWFTEEAVLIDTAGRYTTQDSDASVDKAGWEGFLDLLKRTRERQALNGVLVAISLADIAAAPREERLGHARAIRKRVKEITNRLDLKLPVYALLTKADLLSGFTEFFEDLDAEKRGQVWGVTFPANAGGQAGPVVGFAAEFDALVQRLDERLIDLLAAERSPDRRAMIVGFPAQVASLKAPLLEFLQEAFGGSTLDPAPYLRGVYMASGTQEGTPIDRLTGALSRSFGIDQRRAPSLRAISGRSYFLARLLRDVIFNEAMLGSMNPAAMRRRFLIRTGGFALVGLVFLGLITGLVLSRSHNADAIASSETALATYGNTAASLPLNPVQDPNLLPILPMLDQARNLPFGVGDASDHSGMGFGLYQGGKLAAGASTLYINALDNAMLPRLILQLESEMRGGFDRPDYLYQATRVYLMLGSQGPLDKTLVEAWMNLDWQRLYPGLAAQPVRDDLMQHLVALLNAPLPPVSLDGGLVESARATFSRVSVAERVYSRVRDSAAAAAIAPWIPGDAMGAAGVGLFSRASGKKLTDGIPGFFTVKGFHLVLLPALTHAAKDVADESWVLGSTQQVDPNSPEMLNLEKDVIKLYEHDYESQWDGMLADISLTPASNIGQEAQNLYVLSSPQSPMQKLLASVVMQLQLSKLPDVPAGAANAAGNVAGAVASGVPGASAVSAETAALQSLMGPAQIGSAPTLPGAEVDAYYAPLINYVGSGTGSPMSLTLNVLNQLQQQLATLAATVPGTGAPAQPGAGGDPASILANEAKNDPLPVKRWLDGIVVNANEMRGGSAAQAAAAAFNGAGGPAQLCQQAVAGRYPFEPGSSVDIPLGDFAHLFMPNGLIDTFFSQQVRQFVDMSGSVWHIQAVNGVAPPISQGALAEFQRAENIRELFFAAGSQPTVQFSITPASLDSNSAQVALELGALTVNYAHGPLVPTQVSWPGTDGMQTARLIITPVTGGSPIEIDASGPWALFRLFSQGSLVQAGSSNNYTLTFTQGGHTASFSISAGSVLNPFAPGVLANFRCPALQG